jgi:effector-binding domain-containing protein
VQEQEIFMIDMPQIVQTEAQQTAYIPLTVPVAEIINVMGPGISEVFLAIAAQGLASTGPWLTYHHRAPTDTFDFQICVPVSAPVIPVGRVQAGELRAATVARTVYSGPYEGLGAAWGELMAWIEAEGYTPATDLWECYTVGPDASDDPAEWRTELNRPLMI